MLLIFFSESVSFDNRYYSSVLFFIGKGRNYFYAVHFFLIEFFYFGINYIDLTPICPL